MPMNKEEAAAHISAIKRIADLESLLRSSDERIAALDREIASKDKAIKAKDKEIASKDKEIKAKEREIAAKDGEIKAKEREIAEKERAIAEAKKYLVEQKLMTAKAVNALFGRSSEKTKNLVSKAISSGKPIPPKEGARKAMKRGRKPGTANFDWAEGFFDGSEERWASDGPCPSCGGEMRPSGTETYQKIYTVRQHLRKVTHVVEVYRCPLCGEVVRAEPKSHDCFGRSACTPELAGYIAMLSCGLFMPSNRISELFAAARTPISRELISRYLSKTGELLSPFADKMRQAMLSCSTLQLDETVWNALSDGGSANRVWGMTSGPKEERQAVYYMYSPDRKGDNLERMIGDDYKGAIVSDAYGAYARCQVHQLCWSHLRKYLYEYLKANGCEGSKDYKDVEGLLKKANLVFDKERELSGLGDEELLSRRGKELRPLIDSYFEEAERLCGPKGDDPKSKAIRYGISGKELYYTLVTNPKVPATNNASERSMRKVVMKRVSSLFSASSEGAKSMCVLLSLAQSARMNGLSPDGYIEYLLKNIDDLSDGRTAAKYMPWSKSLPSDIAFGEEEIEKAEKEVEKDLSGK